MVAEQNPYEPPVIGPSPPAVPLTARSQLLPVALGILVPSILHIFGGFFYFNYVYQASRAPDVDPRHVQAMTTYCIYYGITMLYCGVLASGAFSMLRQGSYLWTMSACILALVPIIGPCYIAAIPFGIWGIIVLRRPHVQAAFAKA